MKDKRDNDRKIELTFEGLNSVTVNKLESFLACTKLEKSNLGLDVHMPVEGDKTNLYVVKHLIPGETNLKKTNNYLSKIINIINYDYLSNN